MEIRHPSRFLETAGSPGSVEGWEKVQPWDLPLEFLMNHLRLREGFNESMFPVRTGLSMGALQPGLADCIEQGLLERCEGIIRCTDRGWNFLDDVLARFVSPADI